MPDFSSLDRTKERILSIIKSRGPSLPVQIAKEIGVTPLFASVFLSELKADRRIKASDMKVGSSHLFYVHGQEEQLENFINYLNQREKEAFALLKERGVLEDEVQAPVVRVALRAIKDFAVPMRVRVKDEMKLFWKYYSLSDEEFGVRVEKGLDKRKELANLPEPEKRLEQEVKSELAKEIKQESISAEVPTVSSIAEVELPVEKTKKPKVVESEFSNEIKSFLSSNDMELLAILSEKKKEFSARVKLEESLGQQSYLVIAKDKKSVSDNDLAMALHQAQNEKMLALVVSKGDLNKKAKEYLQTWGNLVKYKKL